MRTIINRIKYGRDTIKNPLYNNPFSYGKIIVEPTKCNHCGKCIDSCVVNAIKFSSDNTTKLNIDDKKCIFCRNCVVNCPETALTMTSDYKLATLELAGNKLKENIYKMFNRSLVLRSVDTGSCNACMLELNALQNTYYDISRFGISVAASPRHADGIIITGPVTINMKEALEKAYYAMAEPRLVIALGSCAYDGGIFKESYGNYEKLSNILPVDLVIPGCPPSPSAIIFGILKLMGKL
jgi:Ni,Fe-hydrogenase III small subunit/NAD-dependent dihydropyrimidine dehydrogenase PreA subunit